MRKIDIKYKGVDLSISFTYQPSEENSTGIKASIEIEEITHKGECFLELLENELGNIESFISNIPSGHED